ncbi:MAG: 23S rRNA (guanosine(2251)-2'-O)-methyltransferase RlmB [Bacteroidales bacterium]|nr:23S rRNA (guanosine(2251)-2'-O)-methyltransferase RlmB [Bacteroidales bacterium]
MEEKKTQYIFGIRPVIEAVRSGRKIDRVLLKKGLENPMVEELSQLLSRHRIPTQWVPLEKMDRIAKGNHQGVIAVIAEVEYMELEELVDKALAKSSNPIIMILDGVTDVRNFGAIARTLECAGGAGLIIQSKGGAAVNADAIKASAGALLRTDICRSQNLKFAVFYLRQNGFRIIAATEKSVNIMYETDMTGPLAIIMGSEGSGITPAMLKIADERVRIPMAGEIGSLNVSAASSVILYEAVRQRIEKGLDF